MLEVRREQRFSDNRESCGVPSPEQRLYGRPRDERVVDIKDESDQHLPRFRRLGEIRQGTTRVSSVLVVAAGRELDQRSDCRAPSILDHGEIVSCARAAPSAWSGHATTVHSRSGRVETASSGYGGSAASRQTGHPLIGGRRAERDVLCPAVHLYVEIRIWPLSPMVTPVIRVPGGSPRSWSCSCPAMFAPTTKSMTPMLPTSIGPPSAGVILKS